MNKLINVLEIISNDQTPPDVFYNELKPLGVVIVIGIFFGIIAISILIASAGNKSKKMYKLGISFLLTPVIIATMIFIINVMFQIELNIPLDFENIQKIQLNQNYDYNITINENLNDYTIIINAKHRISYFKYNYVFYDENKRIINADSNYIEEIAPGEYKSIIIKKPTELMLSGGKINIEHQAYYYQETFLKEKLITLTIIIFISYCIAFGLSQCIYTTNTKNITKED